MTIPEPTFPHACHLCKKPVQATDIHVLLYAFLPGSEGYGPGPAILCGTCGLPHIESILIASFTQAIKDKEKN